MTGMLEIAPDGTKLVWSTRAMIGPGVSDEDVEDLKETVNASLVRIEKHDLKVDWVEIEQSSELQVSVRSHPEPNYLPSMQADHSQDLEPIFVERCYECLCIRLAETPHKKNGCLLVTVEEIMES